MRDWSDDRLREHMEGIESCKKFWKKERLGCCKRYLQRLGWDIDVLDSSSEDELMEFCLIGQGWVTEILSSKDIQREIEERLEKALEQKLRDEKSEREARQRTSMKSMHVNSEDNFAYDVNNAIANNSVLNFDSTIEFISVKKNSCVWFIDGKFENIVTVNEVQPQSKMLVAKLDEDLNLSDSSETDVCICDNDNIDCFESQVSCVGEPRVNSDLLKVNVDFRSQNNAVGDSDGGHALISSDNSRKQQDESISVVQSGEDSQQLFDSVVAVYVRDQADRDNSQQCQQETESSQQDRVDAGVRADHIHVKEHRMSINDSRSKLVLVREHRFGSRERKLQRQIDEQEAVRAEVQKRRRLNLGSRSVVVMYAESDVECLLDVESALVGSRLGLAGVKANWRIKCKMKKIYIVGHLLINHKCYCSI